MVYIYIYIYIYIYTHTHTFGKTKFYFLLTNKVKTVLLLPANTKAIYYCLKF